MEAGGVGPLPASLSRRNPPVPGRGLPRLLYPPPPAVRPSLPPFFCPLIACSATSSLKFPSRAFGSVIDSNPGVLQSVPDGVRRSIVAPRPRRFPLPQRQLNQRVNHRVQPPARIAGPPDWVERVEAEYRQHGPGLSQAGRDALGVPRAKSVVA